MHFAAVVEQAARGFQAEQAAADDRGLRLLFALAMMPWQSSMVRKPKTPCFRLPSGVRTPSIGGMKARLPVAISSLS